MVWLKGEVKQRISNSTKEWYKTHRHWNKGRTIPPSTKQKISQARIGKHYPKLSLAKKGKHRSEEAKGKISLSLFEYYRTHPYTPHSKESKEKNRLWHLGKHHSKETIEKFQKSIKETWQNPEKRQKQREILKKVWQNSDYAKKAAIAQHKKPNQEELYLDAILQLNFPNEFKYVGDFAFWIEGKNPDFINCNSKKIVIEYNGYFRHTKEKDEAKTQHYTKYGFRTLNLYKEDLKDESILIEKIRQAIL